MRVRRLLVFLRARRLPPECLTHVPGHSPSCSPAVPASAQDPSPSFCGAVCLPLACLTLFISQRSLMSSSNQRLVALGTSKGPAKTSEILPFVPFLPHQVSLDRGVKTGVYFSTYREKGIPPRRHTWAAEEVVLVEPHFLSMAHASTSRGRECV